MGRAHLFLLLLLPLHAPRSSFHPVPAAAVPVADGRGATRHPPLSRAGCAAAAGLPVGTLATSAGTLATPERTLVTPAGTLATPTTSRQPTPNSSATSAAPAAPDLRLRLVLIIRPTHPLADPLADAAGAERAGPAISCRSPAISCSCHGSGSAPGDVATTPSKSWVRARTNWPGGGAGGRRLVWLGGRLGRRRRLKRGGRRRAPPRRRARRLPRRRLPRRRLSAGMCAIFRLPHPSRRQRRRVRAVRIQRGHPAHGFRRGNGER